MNAAIALRHANLLRALDRMDEAEEALRALEASTREDALIDAALRMKIVLALAEVLHRQGGEERLEEARRLVEPFTAEEMNDSDLLDVWGWNLHLRGRHDGAAGQGEVHRLGG